MLDFPTQSHARPKMKCLLHMQGLLFRKLGIRAEECLLLGEESKNFDNLPRVPLMYFQTLFPTRKTQSCDPYVFGTPSKRGRLGMCTDCNKLWGPQHSVAGIVPQFHSSISRNYAPPPPRKTGDPCCSHIR